MHGLLLCDGGNALISDVFFDEGDLRVEDSSSLTARGTTFGENVEVVTIAASATGATLDFGNAGDKGENVLSEFEVYAAGLTIPVMGNTWYANVEGANAMGQYAAGTTVQGPAGAIGTGTSPENYYLAAASTLKF